MAIRSGRMYGHRVWTIVTIPGTTVIAAFTAFIALVKLINIINRGVNYSLLLVVVSGMLDITLN